MSSISSANGYTQPQQVQYTPPPPPPQQKDGDTQRYDAQNQAKIQGPAVTVTLSPEAQKALAAQQTQT